MKPVDMLVEHDPPNFIGDCFRCAVASIMELPAEVVPHFGQYDWAEDGERGKRNLREWLKPMGLYYFEIEFEEEWLKNWQGHMACHHILSGVSPRGLRHACVGFDGKLVHDPHLSRAGVAPDEGKYLLGFIVKL